MGGWAELLDNVARNACNNNFMLIDWRFADNLKHALAVNTYLSTNHKLIIHTLPNRHFSTVCRFLSLSTVAHQSSDDRD